MESKPCCSLCGIDTSREYVSYSFTKLDPIRNGLDALALSLKGSIWSGSPMFCSMCSKIVDSKLPKPVKTICPTCDGKGTVLA